MALKIMRISLLILIMSIALIQPINAISAGVSPPKITIDNVLPGNDYNFTFTVYNMGNQTTDYSIEIKGNISNWTYINITKVQVKGNSNYPVSGLIRVPSNIPIGNYTGNILIKSVPNSSISGNKVSVGVNLPIIMNITIDKTATSSNLTNSSTTNTSEEASPYLIIVAIIILIGMFVYFVIIKGNGN